MQNQVVRESQFLRVHNRLVGVVDQRVAGNAPGFVTNYARTVLARGFGVVLIAVKDRAVEEWEPRKAWRRIPSPNVAPTQC